MRTFIITLALLAGCESNKNSVIDYPTKAAQASSTVTETDTNVPSVQAEMLVEWTSVVDDFTVAPSDEDVIFGTVGLSSPTGDQIHVSQMAVSVLGSIDREDTFTIGPGAFDPSDYLTDCELRLTDGSLVAGPTPVNDAGKIKFDGFLLTIPPNEDRELDIVCDFTEVLPILNPIYFAVNVLNSNDVKAWDDTDNSVLTIMGSNNGNPPELAARLSAPGSLIFTLGGGDGSGALVGSFTPGSSMVIMTYSLSHLEEESVFDELSFTLVGDPQIIDHMTLFYADASGILSEAESLPVGGTIAFNNLNARGALTTTIELVAFTHDYGPNVLGGETIQAILDVSSINPIGIDSQQLIENVVVDYNVGNTLAISMP